MKRWPTKPLGEILLSLETGSRPKGGVDGFIDGIPSLGGEHINRDGTFDWESIKYIPREFFLQMKKGRLRCGDILVVKDGATTGKTARVREDFPFEAAAINEHVFLLRTDNLVALPEFVGYFLSSPLGQQQILSNFRGAAIGGIPKDFVRYVHVPLPPLVIQQRLVRLMDEADELRKLRARADSHTAELIPALFYEMFGDAFNANACWPSHALGDLVEFASGGTPSKEKPEYWTGTIPWVSPKGMKDPEINDTEDHVSPLAFDLTGLRLIPKNTVLIVVRGMILAHTVPIRICRVSVSINQDMKALLPKMPLEPEFLRWSLQAQHGNLLNLISTAGHGTKRLETRLLSGLPILQPPLLLQSKFSDRVAEIRRLEADQAASRIHLEALFQSLLHHAFNGGL